MDSKSVITSVKSLYFIHTRCTGSPGESDGSVAAEALAGKDVAEADVVVVDGGVPVEELTRTHRRAVLAEVDALVRALVGGQYLYENNSCNYI